MTTPTLSEPPTTEAPSRPPPRPRPRTPLVIASLVFAVLLLGGLMLWRAESKTNKVALASSAKPVSVVRVKEMAFRPSRTYVGTLEPWVRASVGPQLVSAYVDTVLVRPGALVKRGEVLATLDCRTESAASLAISETARAIETQQKAMASESTRTQSLLDGGFVSPMQAELATAQNSSAVARLEAQKAELAKSSLAVSDCVLRAPFDGEVAQRLMDPGAFVRPGEALVTIVDRTTVRMTGDAPEVDFAVVAPGTEVTLRVFATKETVKATISRRAPSADAATRTVHFEIDVPDAARAIPVGTTGEVDIDVGVPTPASTVPIYAATVRGQKATVFVVDGGVAHPKTLAVVGESGSILYLDTSLVAGTLVVTEGRGLLEDNDKVAVTMAEDTPPPRPVGSAP